MTADRDAMTPQQQAEDRALAWLAHAQQFRRRAEQMGRLRLQALASPHPHANAFARFYAAVIRDDTERALFCDDVARAAYQDSQEAA